MRFRPSAQLLQNKRLHKFWNGSDKALVSRIYRKLLKPSTRKTQLSSFFFFNQEWVDELAQWVEKLPMPDYLSLVSGTHAERENLLLQAIFGHPYMHCKHTKTLVHTHTHTTYTQHTHRCAHTHTDNDGSKIICLPVERIWTPHQRDTQSWSIHKRMLVMLGK